MDIVLDCGDLFFGRNVALELEKNLNSLYDAMNKITVSSELESASLFTSVKSSLKNVVEDDVDDLITRLDNIIKIMRENDQEAAYLFSYYEEGIINGDFGFTEMPLMDQTDYNNISYSQGTISSSGCGLTSICMVASYLTGDLYTPAELVEATRGKGDNVSRMLAAAESVGLVWHNDSGTSREDLKNYLKEGNIAVVLVKNSSHFVVCTGINEDGTISVNDPYGPWAKDQSLTIDQLQFSAGNTWIFNPEENKGVKKELNDKIVANQTISQLIMNENGYTDRTSEVGVVTLPYVENPSSSNNSNNPILLSNNPNSTVNSNASSSSNTVGNTNSGYSGTTGNTNSGYSGTTGNTNSGYSGTTGNTNSGYSGTTGNTNSEYSGTTGNTNSGYSGTTGNTNSGYSGTTGNTNSGYSGTTGNTNSGYSGTTGNTNSGYSGTTGNTNSEYSGTTGNTNSGYSGTTGNTNSGYSETTGNTNSGHSGTTGNTNSGYSGTTGNTNSGYSGTTGNTNSGYSGTTGGTTSYPEQSSPVIQPQEPTPAPQAPETSAPVIQPQEPTPAPQAPETSAPVIQPQEPTPAPQAPETSAPVIQPQEPAPAPQAPETSAPVIQPQQPVSQPSQSYNSYSSPVTNNNSYSSGGSTDNAVINHEDRTLVGGTSDEEYTFTSPFDDVKDEVDVESYNSSVNDYNTNNNETIDSSSNNLEIPNTEESDNDSSKFVAPLIAGVASVAAAGGAYAILNKKKDEKDDDSTSEKKESVLSKLGFDK